MPLRFALGFETLLPNPTDVRPGGYTRDELLFLPFDVGAYGGDGFEVRDVLQSGKPMASNIKHQTGELVVCARSDSGGPLDPEDAEYLLAEWKRTSRHATLSTTFDELGLPGPALLLGWPCRSVRFENGDTPLEGVHVAEVDAVKQCVLARRPAGDLEAALAILRLCAVHQFAVAVTAVEN